MTKEEMYKLNDNELLYLIEDGNEEALEILYGKYEYMIINRIKKFNISNSQFEDFIQEGRLMLHKATKVYRTDSKKTFNKFFDLILQNRFISLLRKNKRYQDSMILVDDDYVDSTLSKDSQVENIDVDTSNLSNLENTVFIMRYKENKPLGEIANNLNITEKQVYNAIQRIKIKIRK